jgi:hypothetical protein
MDDKQLDLLLEESLKGSVAANAHVLDGMENRVIRKLEERQVSFFERWMSMFSPKARLSFAYAGTAIATLIIGIFIGGVWDLSPSDGYQGVTFIVAMPEANQVAVAGDFSGWQPLEMTRDEKGIWALELDLEPGRYEYNFVMDGVAWKPDPRADEYVTTYGQTQNSVKYVGEKGTAL